MLNRLSLEQGKIFFDYKFLYGWPCRQGDEIQLVGPNRALCSQVYAFISGILES